MRVAIAILSCVVWAQISWTQNGNNNTTSSVNGTNGTNITNYTITIIEKKLPDFLTLERLEQLRISFNWSGEAYNRTAFNQTGSRYIKDFNPEDIQQLPKDRTAKFHCYLREKFIEIVDDNETKNSTINGTTSDTNNGTNNDANNSTNNDTKSNKNDANSAFDNEDVVVNKTTFRYNDTYNSSEPVFPSQVNISWRIIDLVAPNLKIVTKLSAGADNETLEVEKVSAGDDGYYMCIVHTEEEIYEARAAVLTVYEPPEEPKFVFYIVLGILLLLILIVLGAILTIRYRRQKALLLSRANNAEAFKNWIKTVIIEKDGDMKDMLKSPVVRIELNKRAKHGYAENVEYELPLDTEWEFPRDRLEIGEGLGEGEFGKVLRAEAYGIIEPEIWTTVAVKMLKESHTDEEMKGLVAEAEIMKMIGKHKNVLSLLGCSSQGGPLLVITEFAVHGSLKDFLRKCNGNTRDSATSESMIMNNKNLISFSRQIAEGMDYLASIKCVHRDLAARNVLVGEDYIMKVADFGLARDIQNNEYYRNKSKAKLPVKWMAPEALFQRVYTCKSDVWSFGILLWEMMTLGGTPYPSVPGVEKLFQILREGYRMESPPNCPPKLYDLMHRCWQNDPKNRPDFSEIMQLLDEIIADNQDLDFIPPAPPSIASSSEKNYSSNSEESDDDNNSPENAAAIKLEKYPLMNVHSPQISSDPLVKSTCVQRKSIAVSEGNQYTES